MTTHTDGQDFRQLTGRFDAPVAPSPSFAASLQARVLDAPIPHDVTRLTPRTESTVRTHEIAVNPAHVEAWKAPRWMRTVEATVAAVIVLSLVTASVAFRQPTALWDFAFQPAPETPAVEINYAGDEGRSWVLGDTEPETGDFRRIPLILAEGQIFNRVFVPIVIGDDLYFAAEVFTGDSLQDFLVRYDLHTLKQVWVTPVYLTGQLASDGERLYGMRGSRDFDVPTTTMVAIEIATGDIAWEGPPLAQRENFATSVALSEGTVFAVDYLGNVIAVNPADGSLHWQAPESIATPSASRLNRMRTEFIIDEPQIVANDRDVFVKGSDHSISRLDRSTGEVTAVFDVAAEVGEDIDVSRIQVRNDRLAINAVPAWTDGYDDESTFPLLIVDAEFFETVHRFDLGGFSYNSVLTDTAIYLPLAPDFSLHRVDLETGEMEGPIEGLTAQASMWLSASGSTLMATADTRTIGFFDLESGVLLDSVVLEGLVEGMGLPLSRPVQMWGSNPIVVTSLGEIYVIEDDEAPPAP